MPDRSLSHIKHPLPFRPHHPRKAEDEGSRPEYGNRAPHYRQNPSLTAAHWIHYPASSFIHLYLYLGEEGIWEGGPPIIKRQKKPCCAGECRSLGVMHRAGSIPAPRTSKIEPSTDSPTRLLCIYHGCIKLGF